MTAKNILYGGLVLVAAYAIALLMPATVFGISIINPSFELDGNIFLNAADATGWQDNVGEYPYFEGRIWDVCHIAGSYGALLLADSGGHWNAGDNVYINQTIDLTGIQSIAFDAKLLAKPNNIWPSFLEADFYVDSTKAWSKQTSGDYLTELIDVTGLTGAHKIEFRLQAANTFNGSLLDDVWYEFDNVRLVAIPEPSSATILAVGAIGLLAYAWRRRKLTV
jgi:hypothetical protein